MKTFHTPKYVSKVANFFERLKNLEGKPDADGIAPKTPAQMGNDFKAPPAAKPPIPNPNPRQQNGPREPEPWSADDMAASFGGQPENNLGGLPKPPVNGQPKEKARFIHDTFQKLVNNDGDNIEMAFSAIEQIGKAYASLLADASVGPWFAKFIASKFGETLEGRYYFKHDDPQFIDDFQKLKASLPGTVQQHLDRIMNQGEAGM